MSKLAGVLVSNRANLRAYLLARGAGDQAEDLLQEMWIKAVRIEHDVEPNPLAYLYRMAERLLLDSWRQATRRSAREASWLDLRGGQTEPPAEAGLAAREEIGIASRRLRALGERVETVFRRYRLEGVEQRAIAAELGVSLSTVEKDLRKAYATLLDVRRDVDAV